MKLKTPAGKWKDVVDILSSLSGPIQVEHGCLGCGHFQSPHYGRILAAMELSETAPEVRFMTIARQEGMEIVGKARGERSHKR
ncbi:MAG: hypothetical protein V3T83_12330 [Acidobacteriota bacterium]